MNTYIYLIRHGEVENPKGIIYGRLPSYGLSGRGRAEIEQTATFLSTKSINALYASPLLRAKQTARIIQKRLGLPEVHISKQIIELRTSYQGRLFSSLDALQSEVYLKPLQKSDETVEQLAKRMLKFVKQLAHDYEGKHVAFVTHGDPAMSLQAIIKGWELQFPSIRRGEYIHHGEVQQITVDAKGEMQIEQIFQPIRK